MPCYQIQRFSLQFTVDNRDYLIEALSNMTIFYEDISEELIRVDYGRLNINLKNETIDVTGMSQWQAEQLINKIKRRYSAVVLEEVTRKNKWLLKKKAEANKFQSKRF